MKIKVSMQNITGAITTVGEVEHCTHASAAGAFQVKTPGSLILKHGTNFTIVKSGNDKYTFKQ